jgi:hypothetical protein
MASKVGEFLAVTTTLEKEAYQTFGGFDSGELSYPMSTWGGGSSQFTNHSFSSLPGWERKPGCFSGDFWPFKLKEGNGSGSAISICRGNGNETWPGVSWSPLMKACRKRRPKLP